MGSLDVTYAASVCIPCKRRKKRCDKGLPSCSRCNRFNSPCSYLNPTRDQTTLLNLTKTTPEYAVPSTDSASSGTLRFSSILSTYELPTLDEITALRLKSLVERISAGGAKDYANFFSNFHISLPFMNQEDFYFRLRNSTPSQPFAGLMLAMSLVAQLSSKEEDAFTRAKEIYPTLKAAYSHCSAVSTPSIDFLQAGMLIACFEYCQALDREAWMTIGTCARMSQILKQEEKSSKASSATYEGDDDPYAVLWYSIAILERIISFDFMENKLPHATEPPKANDILPAITSEDKPGLTITHNLFLADSVDMEGKFEFRNSDFTTLSPFAATLQATYISDLVTGHVLRGSADLEIRQNETTKLDLMLQSFGGALIPQPGKAVGHYCGAFGIRTCALFYLHEEQLRFAKQRNLAEQITKSTEAIRSLTRIVIYVTKTTEYGIPLDLDSIAFWSHKIVYLAAIYHIKYGKRDEQWEDDVEICKSYFKYFTSRYKLHSDYLHEIEFQQSRIR